MRRNTIENILELAEGIGKLSSMSIEVEFGVGSGAINNESHMVELVRQIARRVIGAQVIEEIPRLGMGSEDFVFYLDHLPGAMFRLGFATDRNGTVGRLCTCHRLALTKNRCALVPGFWPRLPCCGPSLSPLGRRIRFRCGLQDSLRGVLFQSRTQKPVPAPCVVHPAKKRTSCLGGKRHPCREFPVHGDLLPNRVTRTGGVQGDGLPHRARTF